MVGVRERVGIEILPARPKLKPRPNAERRGYTDLGISVSMNAA